MHRAPRTWAPVPALAPCLAGLLSGASCKAPAPDGPNPAGTPAGQPTTAQLDSTSQSFVGGLELDDRGRLTPEALAKLGIAQDTVFLEDLEPDAGPHVYESSDGTATATLTHYEGRGWTLSARSGHQQISMIATGSLGDMAAHSSTGAGSPAGSDRIEQPVGDWVLAVTPTGGDWDSARERDDFTVTFTARPRFDPASAGAPQPGILRDAPLNSSLPNYGGPQPILPTFTYASPDGAVELTFARLENDSWWLTGTVHEDGRRVDQFVRPISDRRAARMEADDWRLTEDIGTYRFTVRPVNGDWAGARTGEDFEVTFAAPNRAD
ncbi:hypothetical protein [Engelhardtia mirabilis]|uniref:Uncharacterized protein n=1 Tax=Engelhardtia mirabilis TaxID=2528011 RepID=A0A518BQ93_9BACT|nr:hypothetical protein Pla133_42630 [Planctomycetes bacterium Pla133]QDV03474.1 hypothetical protein Pla86_42620 [Planctomycetes bacterium Pla86]